MSATPTITMQAVKSSQFAAIGHVPELNLLAIQFHPKKSGESDIYHYQNVSAEMFAEFLGADSQGSFFIQRIKKCPNEFPYMKVAQSAFSHLAAAAITNAAESRSFAEAIAPPALTKELMAIALSGREYPFDLTPDEQAQAKAAGLVVIFGASDDLVELRGAIHDERGAPATVLIDPRGLLPHREDIEDDVTLKDFFNREPLARAVDALWCAEDDSSWTYRTSVPHATFDVMEHGIVYCRGIVISLADLGGAA